MHFALPPRKTSHPPPYARPSRTSSVRRRQLQVGAVAGCTLLFLIFLTTRLFSSSAERPPPGTPDVLLVTVLDHDSMGKDYISRIEENRKDYAARHGEFAHISTAPFANDLYLGYGTFFPSTSDYDLGSSPRSWALVPAMRHAMTKYPHTTWFFALSAHGLIMNPSLSLESHILEKKRLESLMLKDKSVVPPDSVIKTFSHLKGDKIDVVLTQDGEGLCQGSFVVRRGEWARFFLDTWFDPLYRSYNFQKAEGHALEHIVQWHPTILTRLALIEQRLLNSYGVDISSRGGKEAMFKDDDFVVRFVNCEIDSNRNCEKEMEPYYNQWKAKWAES